MVGQLLSPSLGQVEAFRGALADLRLSVDQVNGLVQRYWYAIAERDSAIAERDSAIAERDSAIAERDSAIAERDGAIKYLRVIQDLGSNLFAN